VNSSIFGLFESSPIDIEGWKMLEEKLFPPFQTFLGCKNFT
jgi:hypothetical protein